MQILSFYSATCPPSQIMETELEQVRSELSIDLQKEVRISKWDIEKDTPQTEQYAIEAIPTIVVLKKEKELGRLLGYYSKEDLKTKIKTFLTIK